MTFSPFEINIAKLLLCFTTVFLIAISYYLYIYTYWLRRNVQYVKPAIPFGSFRDLFKDKKHLSEVGKNLYDELKSKGCKFGGIYFLYEPIFMPIDPALVKRILLTDFDHFSERGMHFNKSKDPLASHLFNLPTKPWRELRMKLTPTFTSGKLKNMLNIITDIGNDLNEVCGKSLDKPININDFSIRFLLDIIGCTVFGIECNSLKNPEHYFRKIAARVSTPPLWNGLKIFMGLMGPKSLIKLLNTTIMEKEVIKFFLNIVKQNVHYRQTNNIRRNDFFQLLIDMMEKDEALKENNKLKMDLDCMAAQTFVFFAAGFETSSMTINCCLYECARNLDIQNKLRLEIRQALKKHNNIVTYEAIKSMKYLDCVIQETLRKYPPVGYLNRLCTRDYKIPDTDIVIEKGTKILISSFGSQRDPDYFPDPEKFNPDRFNEENKDKIISFTNMPFGEGKRICIGERFGLINTKVGIISLLKDFEFTVNPLTKLPFEFETPSFTLTFKNPLLLNGKKV